MSEGTAPLRIGTAERTSAMKALDAHLEAGRLDVDEYGERSAKAASATVASELMALFSDLPEPHPAIPGTAPLPAVPPATARLPVVGPAGTVAERPNAFLDTWGPRIAAVTPVLAFAIFAISGFTAWWWFLLIPIVGGLVYGGRGGRDRDRRG
jgi:Domain of unknown function (DUF1707)